MRIIRAPDELPPSGRRVCVAIGVFDGVHLGHQQVIRRTLSDAEQAEAIPVVVTFDRHPNAIVAPERVPPLIYSLPQRLRAIGSVGVNTVWLIHFDQAFSQQSGEEFVRAIARGFGRLHSVCVGADFHFGHRRSGNVELLHRLGAELHFGVHGLSAVALDGRTISSTRIRETIRAGDLDTVSEMLGRPYLFSGSVQKGDQLGRRLGFPTANIDATGLVLPPDGVYAIHAHVSGQSHRAVLNIGVRPTVESAAPARRVEAHLLDFDGDLYGQEMEVSFVARLREERKFPSVEDLRRQIATDIAAARGRFAN